MPPERQQSDRPVLDRDHPQLFQPRPFRDGRGRLTQVDVRSPPPQRERGIELPDHLAQLPGGQIGPGDDGAGRATGPGAETLMDRGHRAVEPSRVKRLTGQPQSVPRRDRDDDLRGRTGRPVRLKRPPHPRPCNVETAVGGGASPHNRSIRASTDTGRPPYNASAASTCRCLRP
jgi:hypothetical protein